ncbi:LOW QUALITY PROTEIN: TBC1 domain family member 25 [Menidia menidia]
MAGEEERAVVRVRVKKCDGQLPVEFRSFAVDPQITSLEVLNHILIRAFELSGRRSFSVSFQRGGSDSFLPLMSDGDLDAAFAAAAKPFLQLRLDLRPAEDSPLMEDWDIISPRDVIGSELLAEKTRTLTSAALPFTQSLLSQVGRTLSRVQQALSWSSEEPPPLRPPLSDSEFHSFLNAQGQLTRPEELRLRIYHGGVEPSLRKVVWRYLLNVYPAGLSGQQRLDYMKRKAREYEQLKAGAPAGASPEELDFIRGNVLKDVLRTDRTHPYYAGSEDSPHLAALTDLLTTYAITHPQISYCQGMSDIASPILAVMDNEAHAFICFCGIMKRLEGNFRPDGRLMSVKFQHLKLLLQRSDPEFFGYLVSRGADDLFFCYRWLLLELKREFAFDDALRMLEVTWSSLPPDPPETEVELWGPPAAEAPPPNAQAPPPNAQAPPPNAQATPPNAQAPPPDAQAPPPNAQAPNTTTQPEEQEEGRRRRHMLRPSREEPGSTMASPSSPATPPNAQAQAPDATTQPGEQEEGQRRRRHMLRPTREEPGGNLLSPATPPATPIKGTPSSPATPPNATTQPEEGRRHRHMLRPTREESGGNLLSPATPPATPIKGTPSSPATPPNNTTQPREQEEGRRLRHMLRPTREESGSNPSSPATPIEGTPVVPGNTPQRHRPARGGPAPTPPHAKADQGGARGNPVVPGNVPGNAHQRDPPGPVVPGNAPQRHHPGEGARGARYWSAPNAEAIHGGVWGHPVVPGNAPGPVVPGNAPRPAPPPARGSPASGSSSATRPAASPPPTAPPPPTPAPSPDGGGAWARTGPLWSPSGSAQAPPPPRPGPAPPPPAGPRRCPPPQEFGRGNPFMLFLCLSLLLEHRDHIVRNGLDYNELAMHFDRLVRRHPLARVLRRAKALFAEYLQSELWDSEEGDEAGSESPPPQASPPPNSPKSTYDLSTTVPSPSPPPPLLRAPGTL